jgi:hypothetical protein
MSDTELLAWVHECEVIRRQVDAEQSRSLDIVRRRGSARSAGAPSTASWLRSRLLVADPGRRLRIAAAARQVPDIGEAYARGEISAEHVDVIAKVLPDFDPEVLAAGAGKLLAEQAAVLTPQRLGQVAVRVREHFHPDTADLRAARLVERRDLQVWHTFEGAVGVNGMLDPEGGELFLATLEALTPPPTAGDQRTSGQRRADALVDLCRLAGGHGPATGGERPHVTVTVGLADLQLAATAPPGHPARMGTDRLVTAETARRMACDATIIPAVLGSAGEPLDLGRAARLVSTAQRRALALRDGRCRFPGCDRPPQWTDAHHLVPWADGGRTDLANLVLLCRWHHTAVHEGGWRIDLDTTTNIVTAARPDGRQLDLVSPPPDRPP